MLESNDFIIENISLFVTYSYLYLWYWSYIKGEVIHYCFYRCAYRNKKVIKKTEKNFSVDGKKITINK